MSPYRESNNLQLPKGVEVYTTKAEAIEAMFLYSDSKGEQSNHIDQFTYSFKESEEDGIFHLIKNWVLYDRAPFVTGKQKFDRFIERSQEKGYLYFDSIIIPWQLLDKIIILSREKETISFKWKVKCY